MTKSIVTPQNLICSKQRKGIFYFSRKNCRFNKIETEKIRKWSNMWSCMIFTAVFGKEKSLETFCFKTFSVVEATGLEPTTFWSLTKRATKLRYASICYAIPANSITYYTYVIMFSQAFFIAFLTFFKKF